MLGGAADDDTVSDGETVYLGADLGYHPCHFVSENDGKPGKHRGQRAIDEPDIAVADPGRADIDEHLARPRPRIVAFDARQWLIDAGQLPCLHRSSLLSVSAQPRPALASMQFARPLNSPTSTEGNARVS
jgi:hypothetical protein